MTKLTDDQWEAVSSIFLRQDFKNGGQPRANDRNTLEAILWVLLNRKRWSDLPKEYGAYVTAWRRFQVWRKNGLWTKIVYRLLLLFPPKERLYLAASTLKE